MESSRIAAGPSRQPKLDHTLLAPPLVMATANRRGPSRWERPSLGAATCSMGEWIMKMWPRPDDHPP